MKTALALKDIPQDVRKKLNLTNLKSLTGAILVRDRTHRLYQGIWQLVKAHLEWKRKNGYCGGLPACMTFTVDGATCKACKKAMKNPKHSNRRSAYGLMRMEQRKEASET